MQILEMYKLSIWRKINRWVVYLMSKRTNVDYLSNYLSIDQNERVEKILPKVPFFKAILEDTKNMSDDLMMYVAEIIHYYSDESAAYEAALIEQMSENQKVLYRNHKHEGEKINYSYGALKALGYQPNKSETVDISPLEYVSTLQKKIKLDVRGFYYNERGTLLLEPNTFASYFCRRIKLIQNELGDKFHYRDGVYVSIKDNIIKRLARDVVNEISPTTWNRRYEADYMAAVDHEIQFVDSFDADHDIVNFRNGLLNIKTREFAGHTSDYFSTNQLPYDYDPNATCPNFEAFLNDIFEGDQERVQLIRQILGYIWLKEIKIQKGFIFLGNGSNGKSVLASVMQQLYGKTSMSSTPLSIFERRFGLQELPGKLLNISSENEFEKEFTTENFKQLTSGDLMSVEAKYRDSYTTTLYAKLVILLNRLMDSDDTSDGYFRRLVIIPFNKRYYELKQGEQPEEGISYMDVHLIDKLVAEISGIFNFSLEGLHDLMEHDYQLVSSSVCDAVLEEYKKRQNPVMSFIEDCIEFKEGGRIRRPDIRPAYTTWYGQHGDGVYRKLHSNKVLENLKNELARKNWPVEEVKINGDIYLKNIVLKEQNVTSEGYVSPTI